MTAYRQLQDKAKALGIPYVGVSAQELEKAIKEAETPNEASTETVAPKEKPIKPAKFNTAIVYDKNREVRRYTLEEHGEGFADLAESFADKKEYRVELKDIEPGRKCPHCGGLIK